MGLNINAIKQRVKVIYHVAELDVCSASVTFLYGYCGAFRGCRAVWQTCSLMASVQCLQTSHGRNSGEEEGITHSFSVSGKWEQSERRGVFVRSFPAISICPPQHVSIHIFCKETGSLFILQVKEGNQRAAESRTINEIVMQFMNRFFL